VIGLVVLVGACGRASSAPAAPAPATTQASDSPSAETLAAYDRYRRPDLIVLGLQLAPGQSVADVGAGRGYLTRRLADAVGARGRVVATDIDAAALAAIPRGAPVETRQVRADEPGLEAGAYDAILLAQVDQYLADRVDYLRRLSRALKPRGRIAVTNRLTYREPLLRAAADAGLRVVDERNDLPAHFFVRLENTR